MSFECQDQGPFRRRVPADDVVLDLAARCRRGDSVGRMGTVLGAGSARALKDLGCWCWWWWSNAEAGCLPVNCFLTGDGYEGSGHHTTSWLGSLSIPWFCDSLWGSGSCLFSVTLLPALTNHNPPSMPRQAETHGRVTQPASPPPSRHHPARKQKQPSTGGKTLHGPRTILPLQPHFDPSAIPPAWSSFSSPGPPSASS